MNDQIPNPKNWSLVLIAALLPTYLIRFSVFGIPTTLLEAVIWLVFSVGLLRPSTCRSWLVAAKTIPRPVLISVCFFLLSAIISTIISPHVLTSLGILKGWIITPILYAFMVYAAARKKKTEIRKKIIEALIISGAVVALFSFSQLGHLDRLRGPFDVPNSLALFLAPICVLNFFYRRGSSNHFLFSLFFFLSALAFLLTQSLAGVLSVVVALLVASLAIKKLGFIWNLRFGHWVLIAAAFIMSAIILSPKIAYLSRPGSSAQVRLQLWSISWDLIKQQPLLGIGLGTFEPAYQQKLHERFLEYEAARQYGGRSAVEPLREFVFRDPHNWILSFWLNLGLLGLLSFIAIHVYVFWRSLPAGRSFSEGWGFGVLGALLALLLFGLFDTIYWKNDLATLHWLLLALAASRLRIKKSDS